MIKTVQVVLIVVKTEDVSTTGPPVTRGKNKKFTDSTHLFIAFCVDSITHANGTISFISNQDMNES